MAKRQGPQHAWLFLAAAAACVSVQPTAVSASSSLYGLESTFGQATTVAFGKIDLATGSFTKLSDLNIDQGYYAPVFDPSTDAFYLTGSSVDNANVAANFFNKIDPATGAHTQITLAGFPLITGLAVDTLNGGLYGLESTFGQATTVAFGKIDLATGSFTKLSDLNIDQGYYAPVFDPSTDAFYLTGSSVDNANVAANFFNKIDPATGAHTQITLAGFPLITGLAVDTLNGGLYGLESTFGQATTVAFGKIDLATGSFTKLSDLNIDQGYYAPVFDPSTDAFYLTGSSVDNANVAANFFNKIDPATGAHTQITLAGFPLITGLAVDTTSELASVPEPSTFLMLLGSLCVIITFAHGPRRKVDAELKEIV